MRLLLRLVPLLAFLAWSVALAAPAAALTALTVSPDTDLVDGQVVTVAGSGFTPGSQVGWCQAVPSATPSQSDCGTAVNVVVADGEGSFSGTHLVQRFMFVPSLGRTVDCTNPAESCAMGAAEVYNVVGTAAFAPLQFAPAPPVVLAGVGSAPEGDSGTSLVVVPVTLSPPSNQTVTVDWATLFVSGASGSQADPANDYTPASGTVAFAPGETTQSVSVSVNGDIDVEPDEYIVVSFRNPTNATMGGFWGLAFAGILNDDVLPTVLPGAGSAPEGDSGTSLVVVPVTLSAPSNQTVTVDWATLFVSGASGSQADPANDYTPASGTVAFAPGETTQSVSVSVNGDIDVEPDEYIVVSFRNPTNATMGGFWGLGFAGIQNDD